MSGLAASAADAFSLADTTPAPIGTHDGSCCELSSPFSDLKVFGVRGRGRALAGARLVSSRSASIDTNHPAIPSVNRLPRTVSWDKARPKRRRRGIFVDYVRKHHQAPSGAAYSDVAPLELCPVGIAGLQIFQRRGAENAEFRRV